MQAIAIETVQSSQKKNVITVQPTAFEEAQTDGNAPIEPVQISDDKELSSFVREDLSTTDRPELTSARGGYLWRARHGNQPKAF